MRARISYMLLAALFFGIAGPASATVIYNWVPISNSPTIHSTSGTFEVTDAAYRSGKLNVDYNTFGPEPVLDSPLLKFSFMVNNAFPIEGFIERLSVFPRLGDSRINTSLLLTDNLEGSNSAASFHNQIDLGGSAQIWDIGEYGSDDPVLGCYYKFCSGATGFWQVDPYTVPGATAVPEPSVGLLFAAGLGALGLFRRRMWKSK
jgi:hypothetical protein